jgi:DNA topoisomerase VI subunit B
MRKVGLWANVIGVTISFIGTVLLLLHVTSKYHSAIQDIGSIAVGYLGTILLGVSISVAGGVLVVGAKA